LYKAYTQEKDKTTSQTYYGSEGYLYTRGNSFILYKEKSNLYD
jgi:hypothetical protein